MIKHLFFLPLLYLSVQSHSQPIYDFKLKNAANSRDRTQMLDILRASLYQDYKQEFVFVVNHFKVGNNYAWLKADVQRKDGKKVQMPDDGDAWGCCHVEALFKKSGDKWLIAESLAFSTDVWWEGISRKYSNAPKAIFDEAGRY
jgi:hypothetical protein